MKISPPVSREYSRRQFLGQCCAAVSATGFLSALAQLRLIGAVASPGNGPVATGAAASDYKALVCLFLQGGNDANNVLIPADASGYSDYASARGILALPQGTLLPIAPKTPDGRSYALHPSLGIDQNATTGGGVKSLFDSGQLAFFANVGTLCYPTTKAQYSANSVPLPTQLFAHSDQQIEWQSSVPDRPFTSGWGGRVADLVNAFNSNNQISMAISLNGQNSFQVGKTVAQFAVSPSGAVYLNSSDRAITPAITDLRTSALNDILRSPSASLFDTAFHGVTANAITDSAFLSTIVTGNAPFATVFPTTDLGQQLRMIARLIAAAPQLGLKRQIFFARVGGWDLHASQVAAGNAAAGAHADLLADLSRCVKAFYDATVELGVVNQVTTFTASDFGRTYNTNGNGTDHGWGSHHFVFGGAVKGGDLYGTMPALELGGPDDTGRGRWIPTTSVDEYSAPLATWFGVSRTDLPLVLPNLGRFAKPDLGFMA